MDHIQVRVTHGDETLTYRNSDEGLGGESLLAFSSVTNQVTETKSPSANSNTCSVAWSTPTDAFSSNDVYATCPNTAGVYSTQYKTFGFNIASGKKIVKVEVLVEHAELVNTSDHIEVDVGTPGTPDNCDNHTSYTPPVSAIIPNRFGSTDVIDATDVTSQRSWLPADFNDSTLRVLAVGLVGVL